MAALTNMSYPPPLATYAAKHWDAHAHFEGEPLVIKGAIEDLFGVDKPYFARWVQLRDPGAFQHDLTHPEQLKAHSLIYSARSGLPQLTRHLSTLHPHCINALVDGNGSALMAASSCGSVETENFT